MRKIIEVVSGWGRPGGGGYRVVPRAPRLSRRFIRSKQFRARSLWRDFAAGNESCVTGIGTVGRLCAARFGGSAGNRFGLGLHFTFAAGFYLECAWLRLAYRPESFRCHDLPRGRRSGSRSCTLAAPRVRKPVTLELLVDASGRAGLRLDAEHTYRRDDMLLAIALRLKGAPGTDLRTTIETTPRVGGTRRPSRTARRWPCSSPTRTSTQPRALSWASNSNMRRSRAPGLRPAVS